MPVIAVQAVVRPRDIPVVTSTVVLFQILGPAFSITIAQAIFLHQFLPQMKAVNPTLSTTDIIAAGATGLKGLVTASQLPNVLAAYAQSLDSTFKVGAAAAAMAATVALAVEWKSIKKDKPTMDDS